jgi:hypothetical protein
VVSPKYFEEQSQLNMERAASGTMKKQPRILPLPLRKLRVRVRMTIPSRAEFPFAQGQDDNSEQGGVYWLRRYFQGRSVRLHLAHEVRRISLRMTELHKLDGISTTARLHFHTRLAARVGLLRMTEFTYGANLRDRTPREKVSRGPEK